MTKYLSVDFEELNELCFKTEANVELLRVGLVIFPFNLDYCGHPFFLKELIRCLLDYGNFNEASSLLNNKNLPSVKMIPTNWVWILFARAMKSLIC